MFPRLWNLLIIGCWVGSMGWLVSSKILPSFLGGEPPDYRAQIREAEELPVGWRIRWKEQTLGFAATKVFREPDGSARVRSLVDFTNLPFERLSRQLLGVMSVMLDPMMGDSNDMEVSMLIATEMAFTSEHRLERMRTIVDIGEVEAFLRLSGQVVDEDRLSLTATLRDDGGLDDAESRTQVFKHDFSLPREVLVNDSFTPNRRLANLHIGQTWTIPIYRAFPPNSPIQMTEARVEQHDIIFWESGDVETLLIEYRVDPGSQIQAAREVIGREWVRADGTVLRRELMFAGMKFQFERIGDEVPDPRFEWLEDGGRLWAEREASQ